MSFSILPEEIKRYIFSFIVDRDDESRANQVCREWNSLIIESHVEDCARTIMFDKLEGAEAKELFRRVRCMKTEEEGFNWVEKTISEAVLGENIRIRCFFKPLAQITIEITTNTKHLNYMEDCVFDRDEAIYIPCAAIEEQKKLPEKVDMLNELEKREKLSSLLCRAYPGLYLAVENNMYGTSPGGLVSQIIDKKRLKNQIEITKSGHPVARLIVPLNRNEAIAKHLLSILRKKISTWDNSLFYRHPWDD